MREAVCAVIAVVLCSAGWCQDRATPQTAREALLEMFFSKTPGTLAKHLPNATIAALEKSGAMEGLQQYSLLAAQMQSQQGNFQTYATGSILLSGESPKSGCKVEVTVENDALRGDEDDIELSFVTYKDGQPQRTPFMPRLTFSMKQEGRVWKLNEITVTVHVPLADPDLLKAFTEGMKARQNAAATYTPTRQITASNAGTDAQVVAAMRTIVTAEIAYASAYPRVGFTCTLSDLDGFGGGEPNEHQAMLINSGLAGGRRYGYVFALSGCGAAPAAAFHLSAMPGANTFGRKAFCADQSGTIRSSEDGTADSCFARGVPVQ
ncbi:MAG TPA: hypothetical protein VMU05_13765 [Dongiaceae bacterium]|nr:hypothetical protein [Dongiaceae bacterium]